MAESELRSAKSLPDQGDFDLISAFVGRVRWLKF